jgi:3-hydroxyacyl-CoA dehydrogenase/enoyl-CoA hydratase/3-hydroxybutyryl-CoA epimerase
VQTRAEGAVTASVDGDTRLATLTLQAPGPVNKIDVVLRDGLDGALAWAISQPGLRGIILASGHADFCVGGDVDRLFLERDPAVMMARVRALHACFLRLERCGVPVVAALAGSALGGGLELALACHRRVALGDPSVRLGLPEVTLGLMPGGGGTQRLPRLVGLGKALELVLQGTVVGPSQALQLGLVDDVQHTADEVLGAARDWLVSGPAAGQRWDLEGHAAPPPGPGTAEAHALVAEARERLQRKAAGTLHGPAGALEAMAEGHALPLDQGLDVEATHFVEVACGHQAKDMLRTLWYHRRAADKHAGLPSTVSLGVQENIHRVGILGAGMMGGALAWVACRAGYQVVLTDVRPGAREKAGQRFHALTEKRAGHLGEGGRAALAARLRVVADAADLAGCDLVVEAVFEDLPLKHAVTREVEPLLAPGGIWASNTSALPITELARASAHPDRFVGLHFFSPAEVMPLVEVVRGRATSDETLARALALCRRLGKTPIVVNDGYGFFTTRVFSRYLLEAADLVAEGHDPARVESAARAAGMAVPPLQVFDEVSLSLVRQATPHEEAFTGRRRDTAGFALVCKMVDELGRHGKAAGAGFYDYAEGKRQGLWPGLRDLATPRPGHATQGELGHRLLLAQAVEAVRALEEGVLQRPRDAEVGALLGIGFASCTGGPLSYLDRRGLPSVVAELDALAAGHAERHAVPTLLRDMAARGERFFADGVVPA